MKQFWREVGLAVVMGMMMPGIILNIVTYSARHRVTDSDTPQQTQPAQTSQLCIDILTADDTVQQMELENYLIGVVLAEMPASFEVEALKSQAVVARTYTLRAHEGKSKHETAAVCTDPACCQAYRSEYDYLRNGGTEENVSRIRSAVEATAGQVLTYGGELIEATYFSCSGGTTEDAVAVWGADIPYLQSVSSPGEEDAAYYTDSISFTVSELEERLGITSAEDLKFENITYTAGGGVDELTVQGKRFRGTELRKLLGLRSTAFTVSKEGDIVTFHTRGFGHRVGMSQYGADAMALSGSTYQEILRHYYQGAVLEYRSIDKPLSVG